MTLVFRWQPLSVWPVLAALVVLAIPPIVLNTAAGIDSVPADVRDAARGMGLTGWQALWQVEVPNALPLILAGIRSAANQVIATATVAGFVGLGHARRVHLLGHATQRYDIMAGASIAVIGLVLLVEAMFALLQRAIVSPGVRARTPRRVRRRRRPCRPLVDPAPAVDRLVVHVIRRGDRGADYILGVDPRRSAVNIAAPSPSLLAPLLVLAAACGDDDDDAATTDATVGDRPRPTAAGRRHGDDAPADRRGDGTDGDADGRPTPAARCRRRRRDHGRLGRLPREPAARPDLRPGARGRRLRRRLPARHRRPRGVLRAIESGEIDLVPEYTNSLLSFVLQPRRSRRDPEATNVEEQVAALGEALPDGARGPHAVDGRGQGRHRLHRRGRRGVRPDEPLRPRRGVSARSARRAAGVRDALAVRPRRLPGDLRRTEFEEFVPLDVGARRRRPDGRCRSTAATCSRRCR